MSAPQQSQATQGAAPAVSAHERRALLATCVACAAKGAEVVRAWSLKRDTLQWEVKSHADFVSGADRASEEMIAGIVRERHADARLVGEELTPELDLRGLTFVADPLDGTTNFLHGFPWYAVSVAAVVDGAIAAGAIVNVPTGDLFTAVASDGARRNGQPIAVSKIEEPVRALIGTGMPFKHQDKIEQYMRMLPPIMRQTAGVRRAGSAALDLADVACGRYEAFWEPMLAPWDIAAGILLVREAGGVVTDLAGAPARVAHTGIVAGNAAMHGWMMDVVREEGAGAR